MGQTQYGFVRDYGNAQAYDDYRQMGVGGLLMNIEDPRFTYGLQQALQQGFQGGLWIPAHTGEDPIAYAQRMNEISQRYHPSMLVPNVEFQGKGYQGSPGWDWSEKMMAEFRRLNPEQQLAVSVMGNQDDFNYEAYTGRGAQVWSQAYAGDMTPFDTEQMRQQLIRRGVDPSLINITLAPNGQYAGDGNYSYYALDDLTPAQRARYIASRGGMGGYQSGPATIDQVARGRVSGIPGSEAPEADPSVDPGPLGYNRQAQAQYAAQFLRQAAPVAKVLRTQAAQKARVNPKAVAVQTLLSRPPTKAQSAARKLITQARARPIPKRK